MWVRQGLQTCNDLWYPITLGWHNTIILSIISTKRIKNQCSQLLDNIFDILKRLKLKHTLNSRYYTLSI